jgi:hypothetical protein
MCLFMIGDLDAAEADYATSVELGHIPAAAKLRSLRKLKKTKQGGGQGMAMGGINTSVEAALVAPGGGGGGAAAVPVRRPHLTIPSGCPDLLAVVALKAAPTSD